MKTAISISLFAATAAARTEYCRALALSGGGNRGAWEAGVMWGLAHYGDPEDYHWDVMTGISAGSINAAGSAGFYPHEVLNNVNFLSEQWDTMTTDRVWTSNGPLIHSLLNEPSLLNTAPALDTLREIMALGGHDYKRKITLAAADVNNGEYVTFNQDDTTYYDLA
jgi:predicted acylesterase/phospholipase RssA